jgi:hypothetical protein
MKLEIKNGCPILSFCKTHKNIYEMYIKLLTNNQIFRPYD